MKRRFGWLCVITAAIAIAADSADAATVVFSDTFERISGVGDGNNNAGNGLPVITGTGSSSWGSNDNGLGGTIIGSYITLGSRGGGANQVVGADSFSGLGTQPGGHGHMLNGGVAIDLGSIITPQLQQFSVGFDFDRLTNPAAPATNGGFVAFGIGGSLDPAALGGASALTTTNFGVLFQQANNGFQANADVFENNVNLNNSFEWGTDSTAVGSVLLTFSALSPGAFNQNDLVNYEITAGASTVSGTFTVGTTSLGQFVFSSNNFDQRYVDNLVVSTTAVPEPASLAALSILGIAGGVGMLRRRGNGRATAS